MEEVHHFVVFLFLNAVLSMFNVSEAGVLTVSVGDGRGITFTLTRLDHAWTQRLGTVVRGLSGVGHTLHLPHLLSQTTLC